MAQNPDAMALGETARGIYEAWMLKNQHTTLIHTLFFKTETDAHAAHSQVVGQAAGQFLNWDVQEGGQRAVVVLDCPPPAETWRYLFTTIGPLTDSQINQIHLETGADEGHWNQVYVQDE